MGFLGALFGGGQGAGFQAQGTNTGQYQQALDQSQSGVAQQQAFVNALQGLGGQSIAAQQGLLQQLQQGAAGQGPNPALNQLNLTTSQNIANQAATQAGQRGSSANAGLIARQAAQQGGNLQQQAVQQAALQQAQQQMGYQQMLGQQAGTGVAQQQGALSQLQGAQQGVQGQLGGLLGNQNSANAGVAAKNAGTQGNILGGVAGAVGGLLGLAEGGEVPEPSLGVSLPAMAVPALGTTAPSQFKSQLGKALLGDDSQKDPVSDGIERLGTGIAKGVGRLFASKGGPVPGQAKVKGDSYSNDTVPTMLSPGEIVVPRSHAMDPKKAAKFAFEVASRKRRHS